MSWLPLIIPIRKDGRLWKLDRLVAKVGNEMFPATLHYVKAFRKRWPGYHDRSQIKTEMRCLKVFGERIAARDPYRQPAEIHIRVALVDGF